MVTYISQITWLALVASTSNTLHESLAPWPAVTRKKTKRFRPENLKLPHKTPSTYAHPLISGPHRILSTCPTSGLFLPGIRDGWSHWVAPEGSGSLPWRHGAVGCSAGSCARYQWACAPCPPPVPPACSSVARAGSGAVARMLRRLWHEGSLLMTIK